MKILMFGWEFPPHISGGLGTACYGLTKSLSQLGGSEVTIVLPKLFGDEDNSIARLISAESVDIGFRALKYRYATATLTLEELRRLISAYISPEEYHRIINKRTSENTSGLKRKASNSLSFSGKYGTSLFEEIEGFSEVGYVLGSEGGFDIIHAHDWLTYPAAIAAKKASGKPFIAHIHATEFDRSGDYSHPAIKRIEREGLHMADRIIAVSNFTKAIVANNYDIAPEKIITVHNGVDQFPAPAGIKKSGPEKIVTFMGRVTRQKGPDAFIRAASSVLMKRDDVRFVMAGNGDMYEKMVQYAAHLRISDRFHFTGFLKSSDVNRLLTQTDLYVMPSVSEPFGISPLEAMASGVPVIISKQSGVAEVVKYAIKVNFWDIQAMADAINGILSYPSFAAFLVKEGMKEISHLQWDHAARKVRAIYEEILNKAG